MTSAHWGTTTFQSANLVSVTPLGRRAQCVTLSQDSASVKTTLGPWIVGNVLMAFTVFLAVFTATVIHQGQSWRSVTRILVHACAGQIIQQTDVRGASLASSISPFVKNVSVQIQAH